MFPIVSKGPKKSRVHTVVSPRGALAVAPDGKPRGVWQTWMLEKGSLGPWGLDETTEHEAVGTAKQRENSTQRLWSWSLNPQRGSCYVGCHSPNVWGRGPEADKK